LLSVVFVVSLPLSHKPCLLVQVRVIYCEMLGHDVSFAYIPVLQMASDPNLLNKKV